MATNPFESPRSIDEPVASPVGKERPVVAYASASTRALVTMVLLGFAGLTALAGVAAMAAQANLLDRAARGQAISPEEAMANDHLINSLGLVQIGLLICCAIAFLSWVYRANRNLPALGATHLEFTPGWAVGYWFVPIVNLVRPYQILKEIWLASRPEQIDNPRWRSAPATHLLGSWWGTWLAAGFCARFGSSMMNTGPGQPNLSLLTSASYLLAFADALQIAAAIFAILLVRGITVAQERKSELITFDSPSEGGFAS